MLWPDTFNDHFHPEIAVAATEVLESAGYEVVIPDRPLCCGRPLYDYGMLKLARRQLRRILATLRAELEDGWRSEAVKESLDLCLACKGCKHECPSGSTWPPTRRSSCPTTGEGGAPSEDVR